MSTQILDPYQVFGGSRLIAEYLFSNNYLDTSGNGHNGTNNGTTFTTDRHSVANSAIALNGSDQYVTLPFAMPETFTISSWVKLTNLSNDGTIIGNWDDQFLLYFDVGGGGDGYRILVRDSDDTTRSTPITEDSATTSWQHVLATYTSGANGLNLYIDNVLKETETGGNGIDTTSNSITIGVDSSASITRDFNGALDDIRIYQGILNADQRTALFNE